MDPATEGVRLVVGRAGLTEVARMDSVSPLSPSLPSTLSGRSGASRRSSRSPRSLPSGARAESRLRGLGAAGTGETGRDVGGSNPLATAAALAARIRHWARTWAHSVDASMLERRRDAGAGDEGDDGDWGVTRPSGDELGELGGLGVGDGGAPEGVSESNGVADEIDLRSALPRIVCLTPVGGVLVAGGTTSSARSVRMAEPDSGGELVNTSLSVRPT